MTNDLFTVKFDTNPSPWFSNYVEISFSKKKLQPVVDELVKECSNKSFNASYHYDPIVNKVIKSNWKEECGSKRPYLKALLVMIISQYPPHPRSWSNGHVAVARSLETMIAWATPGFADARKYNEVYCG